MKAKVAGGPVGNYAISAEETAVVLLHPLTLLIDILLNYGIFPAELKIADIVALHKGKSKCVMAN